VQNIISVLTTQIIKSVFYKATLYGAYCDSTRVIEIYTKMDVLFSIPLAPKGWVLTV
jgi:hypothetical protein